jgi:uroporphyrinogen-III synthase
MHILVTRPREDAAGMQRALQALGHTVFVEPMLEIEFCDVSQITLACVQGLIATSRNGVRAICRHPSIDRFRVLPIFAVGPGTVQEAAGKGFKTIIAGAGTARVLPGIIAEEVEPAAGRLLYLAGDHQATDLAGDLARRGFQIDTHVAYASRRVSALSDALVTAIAAQNLQAVILMSPRTAINFVALVLAHGLADMARKLQYFCISPAVAHELDRLSSRRDGLAVFTASKPDGKEVLALLRR